MASSTSDPEVAKKEREVEEESGSAGVGDDEDTGAQVAPIVKLEEVTISTGEEDEDSILDMKAKLYRFDKEGKEWKERGVGNVKLLKHKESGKVRLLMRQSKTLKICANHLVLASTNVQEHHGNDKSCVWHATDFADGELKDELFCIRLASVENCKAFMETVQDVAESQGKKEETKEESDATELLEKLSVEDIKTEKKVEKEVPIAGENNEGVAEKAREEENKE